MELEKEKKQTRGEGKEGVKKKDRKNARTNEGMLVTTQESQSTSYNVTISTSYLTR